MNTYELFTTLSSTHRDVGPTATTYGHMYYTKTHTHTLKPRRHPTNEKKGEKTECGLGDVLHKHTHTHRDKPTHLFKEVDEHANYAPLLQLIMLHKP